jgi:hypothetical protein
MTPVAPSRTSPEVQQSATTVVRPLERAQLVWQRAVHLADSAGGGDGFLVALDLLRTAHHGPSTMLHALKLGRARRRDRPEDPILRDAVRLLTRATTWLGSRPTAGEIGRSG